ncbi:hypothetical protein FQZ97_1104200 [compost metagenome]
MTTEPAASAGVPGRPSGIIWLAPSTMAFCMPTLISRPSMVTVLLSSPDRAWVRRVSMKPKATALTLTLRRPHSLARVLVMPRMPALPAE